MSSILVFYELTSFVIKSSDFLDLTVHGIECSSCLYCDDFEQRKERSWKEG